jgi:hypothetical protein
MQIKTTKPIVGQTHCLKPEAIADWNAVLEGIVPDQNCTFSVVSNGTTYTGVLTLNSTMDNLLVAFNEDCVSLPGNACFDVSCSAGASDKVGPTCTDNDLGDITDTMKLAVLSDEGCLMGFTTIANLKQQIIDSIEITDLINCSNIMAGNLVASDDILVASGTNCQLKRVSQNDIKCPDSDCP